MGIIGIFGETFLEKKLPTESRAVSFVTGQVEQFQLGMNTMYFAHDYSCG